MNKKGYVLHIFGITITGALLYHLFIMFFVVGPIIDSVAAEVLDNLGSDNICPKEFNNDQYKVCFNSEGDVTINGYVGEEIRIEIEGLQDTCRIKAGNYDFEYSGCKLENFKQLSVYNLVLISKTGKVSIKGTKLLEQISAGTGIVKINPSGVKWIKKMTYAVRFL